MCKQYFMKNTLQHLLGETDKPLTNLLSCILKGFLYAFWVQMTSSNIHTWNMNTLLNPIKGPF